MTTFPPVSRKWISILFLLLQKKNQKKEPFFEGILAALNRS